MTDTIDARPTSAGGVDPRDIATGADLAAALTTLRLRAGLSIRDLGRLTGIPPATLGGYFSGRHLPPATQPQLLGQLLGDLGVGDDEVDQWREALLRARRSGGARGAAATRTESSGGTGTASPYRGLEPFSEEDAGLFFGREGVVDELVATVEARAADSDALRLLVLVGPSGSGKSSLLRAGLVPALRARSGWATAVIVPGTDPAAALAAVELEVGHAERALLVVDQAEEIFSPEVAEEQRRAFVQALASMATNADPDRAHVVVAGLRADFYGQAASDPHILPALQSSQLLLGSMSLDELRRAVVRPADAVGVTVDPELVELLVRDLAPRGQAQPGYDAGALPLVSHALLASWQRHRGDRLTVADYVAAGGIAGAVQQTAESVVTGLDEPGRTAAQWLFTQLVVVDDDGVMTRRRVRHDDLRHPDPATDLALDPVIEAFIAGRLLTAGDATIEVSHEALLTAWPRLRDWVLTDLDAARLQHRIADAAEIWRERDHDPAVLLRGGQLADAGALAARPATSHRVLSAGELEFVTASAEQAEGEEATERRRTNRLHALVAVLATLALLSGLLAWTAVRSRDDARHQQELAAQARDEALSRQLAITANDLRASDPALAAQLALAAYRESPTVQARSSLLDSTAVPTPTRFAGPAGTVVAVASPDGSLIAITGVDEVTRLLRRDGVEVDGVSPTYSPVGELPAPDGEPEPTYGAAFSPDGRLLALGRASGEVVLWDVHDPTTATQIGGPLGEPGSSVQTLAFSPDGRQLAAGTSEPAVRRWSVPAGEGAPQELAPITAEFGGTVMSIDFAPTDGTLATGSADGTIRLWSSPTDGKPDLLGSGSVGNATNFVHDVVFDPTGTLLASAEKGKVVRVWDVSDPTRLRQQGDPLGTFDNWVNSVDFSADGEQLAAGSSDGDIELYSLESGTQLAILPNPAGVTGSDFVGSGGALLSTGIDGVTRLWPLPGPVLGGFGDSVWSVRPSADAATLAVGPGAADGSVHLFDTTSGAPVATWRLTPPESAGRADGAASMSPDGRWIAAGTAIGNLALWERSSPVSEPELRAVVKVGDQLVEGAAFDGASDQVAATSDDGSVVVWRLRAGAEPQELHRLSTPGQAMGAGFSPDGTLLAVASTDNQVHLWRFGDDQAEALDPVGGFENYAYAVSFDPTGSFLAAGSVDRTVRIWDVTDPSAAVAVGNPLRGPRRTVNSLDWTAQGDRLAAASDDGLVWVWDSQDVANPQLYATLSGDDTSQLAVAVAPDGRSLVAGGAGRSVRSWALDVDEVAASTCARTGTTISEEQWEQLVPGTAYDPPCPDAG